MLIWIVYFSTLDHGYFPNFFTRLLATEGLDSKILLIGHRFRHNIGHYFLGYYLFPSDILYAYTLLSFAATIAATILGRKSRYFKLNLSLTLFWISNLIIILSLYNNASWTAHRVFMINGLLGNIGVIPWLMEDRRFSKIRVPLLGLILTLNILLTLTEVNYFRAIRYEEQKNPPHVLTQLDLVKSGDIVLFSAQISSRDLAGFFAQNPRSQLIRGVSESIQHLRPIVKKAKPTFVVLHSPLNIALFDYELIWEDAQLYIWKQTGKP